MNLSELPEDLPAPVDDGAAGHLTGSQLPDISLPSTSGEVIALRSLKGLQVLYFYPMTGRPDVPLPDGWDRIPGARGCTPQACSYRDHYQALQDLGADVHGISSQSTDYQYEAQQRLHLPFELLSDARLLLRDKLGLPTFSIERQVFYKRMTQIIEAGTIVQTFYPVFPADENAGQVIAWLTAHKPRS